MNTCLNVNTFIPPSPKILSSYGDTHRSNTKIEYKMYNMILFYFRILPSMNLRVILLNASTSVNTLLLIVYLFFML